MENKKHGRQHYSDEDIRLVRAKYSNCTTRKEEVELATEIGITEASKNLHKLYNLASYEKVLKH